MGTFHDVINILTKPLLALSITGGGLTLITFSVFAELRTYPIKLVMYLCLCVSVGYFWFLLSYEPWVYNTWACWPAAILIHFFLLANFFWSLCVAFNFYQMIVRRNKHSEQLERYFHMMSWGVPMLCVIITAAFQHYGKVGDEAEGDAPVCYIDYGVFRFVFFFVPGLIIVAVNCILFFFIGREIHETLAGAPQSDRREKRKECRVYLSIFISIGLAWVFGYLMFLVPNQTYQDVFLFLFTITVPLQGVMIFFAYCFNVKVAGKWAGVFGKCIPACRRWEVLAQSSMSASSGGSTASTASSAHSSSTSSSRSREEDKF